MIIDVVAVKDIYNPEELNDWFSNHPGIVIDRLVNVSAGVFYIMYTENEE